MAFKVEPRSPILDPVPMDTGTTELPLLKKLRQAAENGKNLRKQLVSDTVNRICHVVLSDNAMKLLQNEGYLILDIRFKNGDPLRDVSYLRETASFDDLEVPFDLVDEIKAVIKAKSPHLSPTFHKKILVAGETILESMRLQVADCRHTLEMNNVGMFTKTFPSTSPLHTEGANAFQDRIAQAEEAYLNTPTDENAVNRIIKVIFDPENEKSPFNQLISDVKERKITGPLCFRIAFNCTETDLNGLHMISEKDRKYMVEVNAKFDEIALFFQKLKSNTDITTPSVCKFVVMETYYQGRYVKIFQDYGRGKRSDPVKLVAEYNF